MEDQPADPGDLTAADEPEPAAKRRRWWRRRAAEPAVGEQTPQAAAEDQPPQPPKIPVGKAGRPARREAVVSVESEPEVVDEAEAPELTDESVQPATVLVAHRPVGKRMVITDIAAGVLFVAAGAFAGAAVQPYLVDRALVDTKLDIARTAADAITTLWTYTPDDMETLPERSQRYLGGDFAAEYRRYIDAIVATNEQAQVTNSTEVKGTAVESLNGNEATALVYTNSVSTSPLRKNVPSLRYLSYRLTMERRGADWLITRMIAVTKLDLTPQL